MLNVVVVRFSCFFGGGWPHRATAHEKRKISLWGYSVRLRCSVCFCGVCRLLLNLQDLDDDGYSTCDGDCVDEDMRYTGVIFDTTHAHKDYDFDGLAEVERVESRNPQQEFWKRAAPSPCCGSGSAYCGLLPVRN